MIHNSHIALALLPIQQPHVTMFPTYYKITSYLSETMLCHIYHVLRHLLCHTCGPSSTKSTKFMKCHNQVYNYFHHSVLCNRPILPDQHYLYTPSMFIKTYDLHMIFGQYFHICFYLPYNSCVLLPSTRYNVLHFIILIYNQKEPKFTYVQFYKTLAIPITLLFDACQISPT